MDRDVIEVRTHLGKTKECDFKWTIFEFMEFVKAYVPIKSPTFSVEVDKVGSLYNYNCKP